MNRLEERLRKLPLASVPDGLGRRVHETLQAHETRHPGFVSMPVPLWICATACLTFLVMGMWLYWMVTTPASTPRISTTWIVEGDSAFSAAFANEQEPKDFFLRRQTLVN
ncbi:MAG: hypothetical protein L6455_09475 [Kiritimatiellae bacterium]|nr:hypothetical protein [Kiritimatiellia bacterium]